MRCFILLFSLFLSPGLALAATMTFDDYAGSYFDTDGDGADDLYTENGISVTGFTYGELGDGHERGHLDNPSDGHFTDLLSFTTGSRFDLASFDLFPLGFECDEDVCDGYENVIITGFRDGRTVAENIFSMGFVPSLQTGSGFFADLDRLAISTIDGPGSYEYGNSHFEIDNVVLTSSTTVPPAPVPLPATQPMLAAALLLLAFGMRKRSAAARDTP